LILGGDGEAGWSDWWIGTEQLISRRLILYDLMRVAG